MGAPDAAVIEAERQARTARPLLAVEGLTTTFATRRGRVTAVDRLSYTLERGEALAIVGESGCGKSVAAMSLLRLIPQPPGRIEGAVRLEGVDLLRLADADIRKVRGKQISMIFQEPMTSLNPVLTVGEQIAEVLVLHEGLPRRAAKERAVELLQLVQIPEPARRARAFPHEMSGGMRQRAMIAMALACNPKVLIADEPTTALDATIQAQILDLMGQLREQFGAAIVLITHNLGVVAENAERAIVMYAGRKVEEAPVADLFARPCHPYTRGLLLAIPLEGAPRAAGEPRPRLAEIGGMVPSLIDLPAGCRFAARCAFATEHCRRQSPPLEEKRPGHWAACWHTDRVLEAGIAQP